MDSYKIEIRYHEAGPLFRVSGLIHVILTENLSWINRKFF